MKFVKAVEWMRTVVDYLASFVPDFLSTRAGIGVMIGLALFIGISAGRRSRRSKGDTGI
ncbi:hypothetical protein [Sphingomonas sp. ID0503]|uniref:hypothetical protein n=1 Tax=Sphingomonas sp. ID0503 TaxID=3399691 RepID=UPI003AFAE7EC